VSEQVEAKEGSSPASEKELLLPQWTDFLGVAMSLTVATRSSWLNAGDHVPACPALPYGTADRACPEHGCYLRLSDGLISLSELLGLASRCRVKTGCAGMGLPKLQPLRICVIT
jgi:hypothetical protein